MIMAALVVLSLVSAGLIHIIQIIQPRFCWVVIIGVVLSTLVRKFGLGMVCET